MRDDQNSVHESGFGDVDNAAVDNDTCIENFVGSLRSRIATEQAAERAQVQHVSLGSADHQAHVGQQQQH